jgi:hypothetical protein
VVRFCLLRCWGGDTHSRVRGRHSDEAHDKDALTKHEKLKVEHETRKQFMLQARFDSFALLALFAARVRTRDLLPLLTGLRAASLMPVYRGAIGVRVVALPFVAPLADDELQLTCVMLFDSQERAGQEAEKRILEGVKQSDAALAASVAAAGTQQAT